MNTRFLDWIGRVTLILGALGAVGGFLWRGWPMALGMAVGTALFYGNLLVLRALGRRLVADNDQRQRGTFGLMLLKFLLLIGVIFAITRYVPLDPLGLMGGVSAGVLAILLANILGPPMAADDEDETGGESAGVE